MSMVACFTVNIDFSKETEYIGNYGLRDSI